jgi:dTDP-4-amino-4,6-dideoxygalactose transaminase
MSNAFDVVRDFEAKVAEYAGSKYAVSIDSCSNALFLCCLYVKMYGQTVTIPKRTYPSVPCAIIHAGAKVSFEDLDWVGVYQLKPFPIIDGAKRFRKGMFVKDTFHCLSFHAKKHLPIGRGGMILTDDKEAYEMFKLMRFDGREECNLVDQKEFNVLGWNFYMNPEQAARGMWLMGNMKDYNEDLIEIPPYPDLSLHPVYNT